MLLSLYGCEELISCMSKNTSKLLFVKWVVKRIAELIKNSLADIDDDLHVIHILLI